MKDSVFEGVLVDLPVDATHIEVVVAYSYNIPSLGTHKASVRRFFPSKAEATFRRKVTDANEAIKSFDKDLKKAIGMMTGLEDRMHKRLTKLERKNDPDSTVDT